MANATATARKRAPSTNGNKIGLRVVGAPKRGRKVPPAELPGAQFAECRSLGHAWAHSHQTLKGEGAVGFVSSCSYCGTQRTKWMSRSGILYPSTYKYPEGYSQHGELGVDRMTTVEWRKTFIVTLMA